MPHYKLTGYHSHRHPFLGFDGEMDLINTDEPLAPGIYEGLAAEAAAAQQDVSTAKIARPFIWGIGGGLIVYLLARTYKVDKRKALQTAFVFGGINTVAGIAMDYLSRETAAVVDATKAAVAPAPGTTPGV